MLWKPTSPHWDLWSFPSLSSSSSSRLSYGGTYLAGNPQGTHRLCKSRTSLTTSWPSSISACTRRARRFWTSCRGTWSWARRTWRRRGWRCTDSGTRRAAASGTSWRIWRRRREWEEEIAFGNWLSDLDSSVTALCGDLCDDSRGLPETPGSIASIGTLRLWIAIDSHTLRSYSYVISVKNFN